MKKIARVLIFLVTTITLVFAQAKGPKVFISVDMEGIWGVVHGDQTSMSGRDYGAARKWMAEDVNAVIAGLFEAGAAEIVVNDSHGGMRNILASDINPSVSLISGSPKPLEMMQGLDLSFDACALIGYHARAGSPAAILDHTISGGTVRSIKINGREMPELGISALVAGNFKVPVIMLSGDTETCAQAKEILGAEVAAVAVKEGFGRTAAKLLPQNEARRRLRDGAREALLNRKKIAPFTLSPPFRIDVEFQRSIHTELSVFIPGVQKTGSRSISILSNDCLQGLSLSWAAIVLAMSAEL